MASVSTPSIDRGFLSLSLALDVVGFQLRSFPVEGYSKAFEQLLSFFQALLRPTCGDRTSEWAAPCRFSSYISPYV